jgi:hypothetical protein
MLCSGEGATVSRREGTCPERCRSLGIRFGATPATIRCLTWDLKHVTLSHLVIAEQKVGVQLVVVELITR